jgi:shikimate kinase
MNVALTGFMGAGKTTTGKRLARLLHIDFVDTDLEIERRHGPIARIFADLGENAFRRIESETIEQCVSRGPLVVAVGGGAVVNPKNREALRRNGVIVHLAISALAAWRRVSHRRHRPLLGEQPDLARVSALLEAREGSYADCDFTIRVDHRTALEAARVIARWYREQQAPRAWSP